MCLQQELNAFLTPDLESQMVVDRSSHGELLRINFNLSFPSLPCEFASLDVSDSLGTVRTCQAASCLQKLLCSCTAIQPVLAVNAYAHIAVFVR